MASSYFELLELVESYAIHLPELEANYLKLQQEHHPDRIAADDVAGKQAAMLTTIALNQARDVLKDDVRRAQYILSLHGIDVLGEANQRPVPPELLMQAMERQEALLACDDGAALQDFHESVQQDEAQLLNELERNFDTERYEEAADLTVALQYLTKLKKEMKRHQRKLASKAHL